MSTLTTISFEGIVIDPYSLEPAAARLVCSIKPRWALKKLTFKKLTTDEHLIYYVVNLKDSEEEYNSVLMKVYPTNSDVYANQEEQFHLLTHLIDQKLASQLLLRFANGYLCNHIPGKVLEIKDQQVK
jgi:hypothetical protein